MPSGVQLAELIRQVRAETGKSTSEAHGQQARDTIAAKLARKQRTLWLAHDWPLHKFYWDAAFVAGQRYVNYPDDLDHTRLNKLEVWYDDEWRKLHEGIDSSDYALYNSDADERTSPPMRYMHRYQTGQQQGQLGNVEIWPLPEIDGELRFHGHERLRALVADTDICTLDSDMLVLYVAGEMLAKSDKPNSTLLLTEADNTRRHIHGNSATDRATPARYGGRRTVQSGRPGIDYVTARSGTV